MQSKIKKFFKNIPLLNSMYQTIKTRWSSSSAVQMLIMHKVLKYNKLRFKKYAGAFSVSKVKDTAYLTWLYHVVEKGLAMPEMKLGFGQEKVNELGSRLKKYADKYGKDNVTYTVGVGTLKQYQIVHLEKQFKLPEKINRLLDYFKEEVSNYDISGRYTREEFYKNKNTEFPLFANSRHSVRNFDTSIEIQESELIDAVRLAQTAPSACNRQATRVHIITDKQMIKQCLSLQNGNRGFGELANKLLIVTGNLQTVLGAQEFFDLNTNVGIFIMNLSYSLHYQEIAHSILNWYAMPKDDRRLRKIVGIPDEENIVAFIVCGRVPDEFKIAISPRMKTEDIVKIH